MSIAILASSAISALVPYLKKGFDAFSGEAGKGLYQWISGKFTEKNRQVDLDAFKKEPDNDKLTGRLEAILENIIAEHHTEIEYLNELVARAQKESITVKDSKNFVAGPFENNGYSFIGDNNTIHISQTEPLVGQLIAEAKGALRRKDYHNAREILNKVLTKGFNDADVYYYSALAVLAGRRPKILGAAEIEEVIHKLNQAIAMNDSNGCYYYLKAIVLHDFSYLKGFIEDRSGVYKLLESAEYAGVDNAVFDEMLSHIPGIAIELMMQ